MHQHISLAEAPPLSSPLAVPSWLSRKWTWKRAGALVFLWVSMMMLAAVHLVSRSLMGIIEGIGNGLAAGIEDTWRDFRKYWGMFEECE
jgi:hypothetical protein